LIREGDVSFFFEIFKKGEIRDSGEIFLEGFYC